MGRRLGQHFLVRTSTLERIAAAACPPDTDLVVEIGPGKGALTAHLFARARRVVAIEIDPILVQYLRAKFRDEPKLTLIEADILKADLAQWGPLAIAGNLPYYITSPIVEKALSLGPALSSAVFLTQKEVAERLNARPGTRDYGYLSVQTQFYADVEILFGVPAGSFRPPPMVDSAVVRLKPRLDRPDVDAAAFLRFASQCFQQKRKKIRNNLLGEYDKALLDSIPETACRAEQLTLAQLAGLFRRVTQAG